MPPRAWLIGSLLLIGLPALMIRTIHVARKATDDRQYNAMAFAMIAIQTISNIGCACLLPVMGVTLLFFSAGGSSSACLYLGFSVKCVAMHPTISDHIHIRRRGAITSAI
ncbi:MAG: FtsW/RodA/SpoVE family cell cycle protein [[Clostridium] leptum]